MAKNRLGRLWAEDPRCVYCAVVTVRVAPGAPKPRWATLDHLITRHQGRARSHGEPCCTVLACYECNQLREEIEGRFRRRQGLTAAQERWWVGFQPRFVAVLEAWQKAHAGGHGEAFRPGAG